MNSILRHTGWALTRPVALIIIIAVAIGYIVTRYFRDKRRARLALEYVNTTREMTKELEHAIASRNKAQVVEIQKELKQKLDTLQETKGELDAIDKKDRNAIASRWNAFFKRPR